MKKSVIKIGLILTIITISVSCSHQGSPSKPVRDIAAQKACEESIKPEYHSYFDSIEKCMDK